MRTQRHAVMILLFLFIPACAASTGLIRGKAPADHVERQLGKLAPVTLGHDLSMLNAKEAETLRLLVRAATCMDDAFLRQVWEENLALREELARKGDPLFIDFYKVMYGPWDRLDEDKPYINELPKFAGANYYPIDMTKEEFRAWVEAHPHDKEAFESNFTVIRREGGSLEAVPYSEYFRDQLEMAADLLRKAAEKTGDSSLRKYLAGRAEAFLTDDYFRSDMDWMDLSGDIEVVIGPYEVYEDTLLGYKAAFSSFVCVVDRKESDKLKMMEDCLNELESNLPVPDRHKNFERGASSPMKVVDLVFSAGDGRAGIMTLAFNLPNDERVREAKGSKKVMLKNIMNAKFDKILTPIVSRVLSEKDRDRVTFDAYFNHILMHEVSHGLGPGNITLDGRKTSVNVELKDHYSMIEECKADVLGMLNLQYLIDRGAMPQSLEDSLYATYLGGMFRTIRFGIGDPYSDSAIIQINWCLDKGGFGVDEEGRIHVNDSKIKEAVKELAHELLMIQALGDYTGAAAFKEAYCRLRPEVRALLDLLKDLPVDVRPVYPLEKEVLEG